MRPSEQSWQRNRERNWELIWVLFVAACLAGMLIVPAQQTIPFHWIWISLAVLSGFRLWSIRKAVNVTLGVMAATTIVIFIPGGMASESIGEVAEVPLMAAVYAAMVWHSRRRQQALDAVKRSGERERDFVRDAAHELRTPITVARGHAELLRDALALGTQERDDTEIVLDELRRLSRMSERLLMLSSAAHEDFLLNAPVNIGQLVREVARRWRIVDGRELIVRVDADGVVSADVERLRIALDALIENALNVIGPDDRVTLVARSEDGRAVLEVLDNGPGIGPADHERIFDRFARPVESRRGTGLGLPIVRAIALAHGGHVALRSAPGQGARFAIVLGQLSPSIGSASRPPVAAVALA